LPRSLRACRSAVHSLTYRTRLQPFQDTTKAKTADFETAKAAYLLEYPDGWSPEGADAPAASADTPKKRGRKTAAEKAALAAKAAGDIVVDADELSPEEIKKAEKKAKKEAKVSRCSVACVWKRIEDAIHSDLWILDPPSSSADCPVLRR
jgi:hypothetical protein